MDKSNVAEVLRALASGDKARSETARLRDVFDEVEAALQAGVSRAAILESLNGQGFTMGMKGFESALYRIRKNRSKLPGNSAPTVPAAANKVPMPAAPEPKELEKQIVEESSGQSETQIDEVQAALSSDNRDADMKKYAPVRSTLKDRLNKGETK